MSVDQVKWMIGVLNVEVYVCFFKLMKEELRNFMELFYKSIRPGNRIITDQ